MTQSEILTEALYRYKERLGILCGADTPTPEQEEIARREADAFMVRANAESEQQPK